MRDARYKRNRQGTVVHTIECQHAANGIPWYWLELDDIADHTELAECLPQWVRPCSVCIGD